MPRAFTRAISPHLAACELTHLDRVPIDPVRAQAQHAGYEAALAARGLEVIRLPPLPGCPDGVFVEDTAVLLDGHAIIARPGAASRAAEAASTEAALAPFFTVHALAGGALDGGDVLRIGRHLYCGLSARTDAQGVAALAAAAAPLGFSVTAVAVHGCLHLKTAITLVAGDDRETAVLLCNPAWIDTAPFAGMRMLRVAKGEDFAANTLRAGGELLMQAGAPHTEAMLRAEGFAPAPIDIGELQKAEAGLTCMSLIG